MKEKLRIQEYDWYSKNSRDDVVEVEYVPAEHYNHRSGLKAYDVKVGDKVIGQVRQVTYTSSTTYKGTRIRRDYGKVTEWSWHRIEGNKNNSPGLYGKTRRQAVAELLGYNRSSRVERVK
jgi:hypothetical protein